MHVIVHSSLSSLGRVTGGAAAVADSLVHAVGEQGTVVVPAFTPQVADPDPSAAGVADEQVRARRAAVPVFTADLPSPVGAIAEAVRCRPGAVRSRHPQASVAAVGARAAEVVADQPWRFAIGPGSPFARLLDLDAHILLIGVGHDRNSFLHHAESLTARPRLKLRRFPMLLDGERVWWETLDVGDDGGVHFPVVGAEYERAAGITATTLGAARVVLLPARSFVAYATTRLSELLDADRAKG
ncbi:aminoglycoside N(3)-acetyltransferase [Kineococcus sp. R8]|uniref:aminoglycoside N(3)-acetyltransferase n=1 Tax=Kineococcus siccus TaxID=2696567 RepID=UPI001413693B|nr:AAC(3) family N-acetyltransferase [Kineococcus siccus]NAZ82263.1 aminoglycoside N(3)-acetyltransferase [Kineococcus siccus]